MMFSPDTQHIKRFGLYSLIGLFLFLNVVGVFGVVPSASAQVSVPVTDANTTALVGMELKKVAKETVKETKLSFKNALLQSFLSALVQGASYFTRKLAYDSAKWVANGGKGQSALAFDDGFGKYVERTMADAGATAVEEFGQGFGLSLCSPPNLNLQLYLQLSIPRLYPEDGYGASGPSTSCTYQQLQGSWNDAGRSAWRDQTGDRLAENFSRSLQVDTNSSDFGIALSAIGNVDRIRSGAKEANVLDRLEGGGFKAVTDYISGDILTPGDIVRYETKSVTKKDQGQLQADQIAGIYSAQALNVIPQAGSIFLNTLVSEGIKNLLSKKGLIPQKKPTDASVYGAPGRVTLRDVEDAVSFFLKSTTPRTTESIDIVSVMAGCPEDSPSLNSCVMDSGLYDALIRESRNQQRLTIAEAIEEGMLNRDWPLIPPTNGLNDDLNCYDGRYCYSNIQKMRKVNILPLGFEVAALRSDPDQPWTLGQVVSNFENCGPRNPDGSVNPDRDAYPFCHLIDPNWVLREPVSRCEAQVFGPELAGSNTNIRREECVDISTCVSFDENGKCEQYGYCTREQNVWEIPGDQCDEQFATCETFIDTQSKKASSFLTRTLDSDECTSDSVGCRAYSTEKVEGEWVSVATVRGEGADEVVDFKQYGRNRSIFFDKDILAKTCPNNQAGCSAFFLLDETNISGARTYDFVRVNNQKVTVNIKKAPEYLNCYDTDPNEAGIQWPTDPSELALLSNNSECLQYAPVCLPEEVGCDGYTPVDGNDTVQVPGIIGENACSAQCVRYGAYRQLASVFEPSKDPLYFIPKDAESCSLEYVGCSEFTNLDELARGGEARAYFTDTAYCEKPVGTERLNEKVFYTWEGSVQSGYVIKTHKLKKVSESDRTILAELLDGAIETAFANVNAPAVPQLSKTEIDAHYARCNEAGYSDLINGGANPSDADCREFIDEAGNRYYRLLGETVRVSDQCSPYRISQPVLESDSLTQEACGYAKGMWDGGMCQRCMGGGEYRDGACIYNILASESNSCPATANQCRSYTGNFAANVRTVAFFDFEPQGNSADALLTARGSWKSGSVVTEAVQVGGSSLQINSDIAEFELAPNTVSTDAGRNIVHTLSFWARGLSQTVRIEFYQGATQVGSFTGNTSASIGDNWRRYEFGPIAFTGNESVSTTVRFTRVNGSGTYFIDNLRLSRVEDTYAFIKDSWKTPEGYNAPLACDSNPVDAFPGEQLGCSAYTQESDNATVYATGFQELCREEAIGCRALVDTYNTEAETGTMFNVSCYSTSVVSFDAPPLECTGPFGYFKSLFGASCLIEPGRDSCLIDTMSIPSGTSTIAVTYPGAASINVTDSNYNLALKLVRPDWPGISRPNQTLSLISYPPDTPKDSPIFLSTHNKYACDGKNYLGCEIVGLETGVLPGDDKSTFVTTTIINSPYIYKDILCTNQEIGCSEYSTDSGLSYFKDPAVVGSLMCQYTEGDGIRQPAGWYLDGIGRCGLPGADEMEVSVSTTLPYCHTDADCSGGTTCRAVNKTACYPNYLVGNGAYGMFSNDDASYGGFVGMCPAAQNGCTEFIDRADTNTTPDSNGRAYYTILDAGVLEAAGECGGKASLREGCVLFDQTNNPARLYNTKETYAHSERVVGELGEFSGADRPSLVAPVTTGAIDSNIILKVGRDRECSEWLACRGSVPYTTSDGRLEHLCYDYDVCNKATGENCGNFVSATAIESYTQLLTQEAYVSRDTSWYGRDYSGYSLLNKYPVADFRSVVFGSITPTDERYAQAFKNPFLLYQMPSELLQGSNQAQGCVLTSGSGAVTVKPDWSMCGANSGGRCVSGACLYPIGGSFPSTLTSSTMRDYEQFVSPQTVPEFESITGAVANACKAFPEENSPFPDTVLLANSAGANRTVASAYEGGAVRRLFKGVENKYASVSICQDGNCVCDYTKVIYDDETTDYFSSASTTGSRVQGYCASADTPDKVGAVCSEDRHCSEDDTKPGFCVKVDRIEQRMGTLGFCLEYDLSRPVNGLQADGYNASKYACLTWLPLKISASSIDVYNQDTKAGYEPAEDAEASGLGGEMYCLESTSPGSIDSVDELFTVTPKAAIGEFRVDFASDDNTWYGRPVVDGSLVTDDELFRKYGLFDTDGYYRNVTDDIQYSESATNRYGSYIFRDAWRMVQQRYTSTYDEYLDDLGINTIVMEPGVEVSDVMQNWAQRFYSRDAGVPIDSYSHAKILRVEMAPNKISGDGYLSSQYGLYRASSDTHYFVYSLFGDLLSPKGNSTLLHPPRFWDERYLPASGSPLYSVLKTRDASDANRLRIDALSPDAANNSYLSGHLFVSEDEKNIRDFSLRQVSFIPYLIPDYFDENCGASEVNCYPTGVPSLLSQDVLIPFSELSLSDDIPALLRQTDQSIIDKDNAWTERVAGKAVVYSYMLEKRDSVVGSCGGLLSHCQYAGESNTVTTNPRNEIYRRYVAVYAADEDVSEDGIQISAFLDAYIDIDDQSTVRPPRSQDEDPFSRDCSDVSKPDAGLWFAIGMDFNERGEFLGYIVSNCHEQSGMQMMVVASEYDVCTDIAPVHTPLGVVMRNKAWTDRVWQYGADIFPDLSFRLSRQNRPFGSLAAQHADISNITTLLRRATFFGVQSGVVFESVNTLQNLFSLIFARKERGDDGEYNDTTFADSSGSTVGTTLVPDTDKPQVYSLNPFVCNEKQSGETCSAGEVGRITVNGKNANTRDYNGDGVADEDTLGALGTADGTDLIGVGSYKAQVRFFGIADRNHMPIRRVMVRWDEDSTGMTPNVLGFQKNRKPYCAGEDGSVSASAGVCQFTNDSYKELTCVTADECKIVTENDPSDPGFDSLRIACQTSGTDSSFGNSSRACQEGYFEFQHTYGCDAGDLSVNGMSVSGVNGVNPDMYSRLKSGYQLSDTDQVCVYKPGVQVLDNWGWCNASVSLSRVGNIVTGATPNPAGAYSGAYPAEVGTGDCTPARDEAWSYFNGIIIVVPEDALPGNR